MPEEGRRLHDTDLGKETDAAHRGREQMDTKLSRIVEVAKTRPKERFTSLSHLLDKQMLWDCHLELPADKATGIDEVTKAEYEKNLEANLEDLVARMKRQAYKPQPSRRTYIPKDEKNLRPLGIPAYEDKIVQKAMCKVLNAIYEQKFLNSSYGFRPGRNQHQALRELDRIIMRQPIRYVVDADIKGFFNHVDHDWLMKFLAHDIADPNFLRLIRRFLKAGIIEDGTFEETTEGTPQGGLISPILGNVYLHYALDLWFEIEVKRSLCKGKAAMVRFADDFVCCFEYEEDAKAFYTELVERLKKFNLSIAEEKTKIIRFGRGSENEGDKGGRRKPGTFDFLGFRHIWGKGKSGKYRLLRKTSPKKFRTRVKAFKDYIRRNRHMKEQELVKAVRMKLNGHYQYYGVSDNFKGILAYYRAVLFLIRKWRNRRGQKLSFTIEKFEMFVKRSQFPLPNIKVNLFANKV
ncbi:group II intron reverse transcriptase/maturase [Paenibacillaceae bacterium WGS1546]|uniref:group II intron reverse transcriptase/maturase n=1 Tax=Cohnella sp. WGS1546 TaxID=3366810 RepID=UPI00372CFA48